jgi:hypothetical protein
MWASETYTAESSPPAKPGLLTALETSWGITPVTIFAPRTSTDVMEVVDGVNNYLQGIVIYGIELARFSRDWSQLDEALDTAKKYVTDAGANSRPPADRLESMINVMTNADVGRPIIDATRKACEEAIRSKR